MKFSVLIAHYNNARFFKDCLDSLLKQTYTNWEAVILDDASSPDDRYTVQKMIADDHRFSFYENKKNSGVGITKAKLIELASGDICGFVDPDDAILPNAIESAVKAFRRNKHTVLTYSRFMMCDDLLHPIAPFKSAMQVQNNDIYFFNYPVQIAHFVCFRKDIYETTEKMDTTKKIAEDQDLYLKMYEKGAVKFIDETNYLYRTHSSGISQNENKPKSYEYWGEVIFKAMKRRELDKINGVKIPKNYPGSAEVFKMLEYQNSLTFRIKKKLKIFFQNFL